MNQHNDFRYVSEAEINRAMTNNRDPSTHPALVQDQPPPARQGQGLRAANDLARTCASACYRIRTSQPNPKLWGPLIAALPEEQRELTRTYLVQFWRGVQDKAKREAARDSEVAREAMARASELVAKL